MKNKINALDIILIIAAFAVCFSFAMVQVKNASLSSRTVKLTVTLEPDTAALLKTGDAIVMNGVEGRITGIDLMGGESAATVAFAKERLPDPPKIGEKASFSTQRVRAEGFVYSITETEGDGQ